MGAAWAKPEASAASAVDAGALIRLTGGLFFVILFILGLSWALRRFGGFSGYAGGKIKALASIPVGNRERVVLVQVGKQQLLIGVAPGRVQTLLVLDEPVTDADAEKPRSASGGGSFAERLRRVMQQQNEKS
ncbi:flagellar biosynthetic protein FliO [Alkalilimnicola ehrlichii]|uniref:Flagellar protein n=2 Tax=Alkalilimnicola ehrlichii TaxID=351052 RepID=A0A3E0WUB1_9GAMM|nr:flagellar biosynthetic protein FliO [Alkalilimnicola ehrlichii]RFA35773.1 flagellar biosynthetic protein FliO [Alkalilimnicola ehrlichii]